MYTQVLNPLKLYLYMNPGWSVMAAGKHYHYVLESENLILAEMQMLYSVPNSHDSQMTHYQMSAHHWKIASVVLTTPKNVKVSGLYRYDRVVNSFTLTISNSRRRNST